MAITLPGSRPPIALQGRNFQVPVTTVPQPLSQTATFYDGVVFDVISTAAISVFLGFGSGVSLTAGIEIQPGIPIFMSGNNSREQWELQRQLEAIKQMFCAYAGLDDPAPAPFMSPLVTIDLSQMYVVASAAVTMAVMAFLPAQFQ